MKQKKIKLIKKTQAEIRRELREIVYEARRQKLAQKAAAVSKKAVSFSWDAVKAFVSDVQFKKEKETPQKETVSTEKKATPSQNIESKSLSYYDRWYNAVAVNKQEL